MRFYILAGVTVLNVLQCNEDKISVRIPAEEFLGALLSSLVISFGSGP